MITARGAVRDGAFVARDRKAFDEAVGKLPDGPYVLTLEDAKEARSFRANRFYWGAVVSAISDKTGYTKDEIHDILKHKFNRRTVADPQTGEVIEVDGSTQRMIQADFTIYVDSCIRWASELGIYIQPQED